MVAGVFGRAVRLEARYVARKRLFLNAQPAIAGRVGYAISVVLDLGSIVFRAAHTGFTLVNLVWAVGENLKKLMPFWNPTPNTNQRHGREDYGRETTENQKTYKTDA